MPPEPRPTLDDATVLIPTLGREILARCLGAIAGGTRWPARILVVHQGEDPRVAEWCARLSGAGLACEHVPSARRGKSAGVNEGLSLVPTRFVAITDDDCLVEAEWLARLTERLRSSPEALVTGRVEPEGPEPVIAVVTSREPARYDRPRLLFDSLSGGNMGAALEVLRRVGPLDEDLAAAEDCEYAYRALRRGVPILYAPDAVVRHFGWRDAGERAGQYRGYARCLAAFYGKYLRRGDAFIALRAAVNFLRAWRRWARGVLQGDPEQAAYGKTHVREFLPGLIAGWRGRTCLGRDHEP